MRPSDIVVPVEASPGKPDTDYRTAILRLDSFLGEWQSPEYYENITPPPASSLMIGTAKAELLKREDYTMYTEPVSANPKPRARTSSLWAGSPNRTGSPSPDGTSPFTTGDLSSALTDAMDETACYTPLRPTYAISGSGKILDGFVAHARDECVTVDCQWDSSRGADNFGDGGTLPEEWTTMHKRFRRGVKRMLNWYATAESPTEPISGHGKSNPKPAEADEDIETVVVIVSHGAGCNALIGAITHQPVLMDVGIASITLGTRKESLDYAKESRSVERCDSSGRALVAVDTMYEIRISASSEHLRTTSSTPVSARSSSTTVWNAGSRGRTSTIGSSGQPNQSSTTIQESYSPTTSRSCSASFTVGSLGRTNSTSKRTGSRVGALASTGLFSGSNGNSSNGGPPPPPSTSQPSLWRPTPAPSSLRLMDDGSGEEEKENDGFPNFDQSRLSQNLSMAKPRSNPPDFINEDDTAPKRLSNGPILAAPIKIKTSWGDKNAQTEKKAPQEVKMTHQLGDSMGGLWGQPSPREESGPLRDMSQTKRRWTVTERSI